MPSRTERAGKIHLLKLFPYNVRQCGIKNQNDLARAIRQKMKCIRTGKEAKLSIFGDMILYRENPNQ